jgi:hypothetical protein
MAEEPRNVSLEDVTAAAVSGVLRALEARQPKGAEPLEREFPILPWPILIGIIMNPGEPFLTEMDAKKARGDG